MNDPTPVQLQILRQRFPNIGEPTLRRSWRELLGDQVPSRKDWDGGKQYVRPEFERESKPRIRQDSKGLNKTEAAFDGYLRAMFPGAKVRAQDVTIRLANGVRYTPDFVVITDATNGHRSRVSEWRAYEVKGFMREDAAIKLKCAASLYPEITFFLVTKRKKRDGGWDLQEVLP